MPISANDQLSGDEEEELAEDPGAILDWKKGDGTVSGAVGLNGVCWMILAVILVSGRAVVDSRLTFGQAEIRCSVQSAEALCSRQGHGVAVQVDGQHRPALPSEIDAGKVPRRSRPSGIPREG